MKTYDEVAVAFANKFREANVLHKVVVFPEEEYAYVEFLWNDMVFYFDNKTPENLYNYFRLSQLERTKNSTFIELIEITPDAAFDYIVNEWNAINKQEQAKWIELQQEWDENGEIDFNEDEADVN